MFDAKQKIDELLALSWDQFQKDLLMLKPSERVKIIADLISRRLPKAQELTINQPDKNLPPWMSTPT